MIRDAKGVVQYTCDEVDCEFRAPFASTLIIHTFVTGHTARVDCLTHEDEPSAEDRDMALKAKHGLGREE